AASAGITAFIGFRTCPKRWWRGANACICHGFTTISPTTRRRLRRRMQDIDEYVRAYSRPGVLRAGF
ncbi:MAG TPA: hypothetical protein QF630_08700, partial [Alphaproteobacteria bacterium]|nr:hypothetical protein [Alphaproteobacteria bacterium]